MFKGINLLITVTRPARQFNYLLNAVNLFVHLKFVGYLFILSLEAKN